MRDDSPCTNQRVHWSCRLLMCDDDLLDIIFGTHALKTTKRCIWSATHSSDDLAFVPQTSLKDQITSLLPSRLRFLRPNQGPCALLVHHVYQVSSILLSPVSRRLTCPLAGSCSTLRHHQSSPHFQQNRHSTHHHHERHSPSRHSASTQPTSRCLCRVRQGLSSSRTNASSTFPQRPPRNCSPLQPRSSTSQTRTSRLPGSVPTHGPRSSDPSKAAAYRRRSRLFN